MIADMIIDRKEGDAYDVDAFINYVVEENDGCYDSLIYALAMGREWDAKAELSKYIICNGWAPDLCGYVWAVDWAKPAGLESSRKEWYRLKMMIAELWYDYKPYDYSWAELLEMKFDLDWAGELAGLKDLAEECQDNDDDDYAIEAGKLIAMVRHMISNGREMR